MKVINFLILRDFSGISEFIFDLNILKTIKKILKRGLIFAWVPRGCDMPRGSMRAPAWHEGDTWALFIFNRNI